MSDVYPQSAWAQGRQPYQGNPFDRVDRQVKLATEMCSDVPLRLPTPAVAQLVHVDQSVRCYYTHPFEKWACQEFTFFHVLCFPSPDDPEFQIVPSCPEHLSLAFGLGLEIVAKMQENKAAKTGE